MAESLQRIQDATLLIQAFEEGSTLSTSELSAYVPVARATQLTTDEMKVWQEAFTPNQALMDQITTGGSQALEDIALDGVSKIGVDPALMPESPGPAEQASSDSGSSGPTSAEYFESWVKDCVPCWQRFVAIKPGTYFFVEDILEKLYRELINRLKWLLDALDLFTNVDIYEDLCRLFQFLSFQCVPDLATLILFLIYLMTKWNLDALLNIGIIPGFWIGMMFYLPFLLTVYAVLTRYLEQLFGTVICIEESLVSMIQKLFPAHLDKVLAVFGEEASEFGKDVRKVRETAVGGIRDLTEGMGKSLELILEMIRSAQQALQSELKKIGEAILSFFTFGQSSRFKIIDFTRAKVALARVIGIIRFFIEFFTTKAWKRMSWDANRGGTRGGILSCIGPDDTFSNFMGALKDYMTGAIYNTGPDFSMSDEGLDVKWIPFPDSSALEEAAGKLFGTESDESASIGATQQGLTEEDGKGDRNPISDRLSKAATAQISFKCPELAKMFAGGDDSTVEDWLRDAST